MELAVLYRAVVGFLSRLAGGYRLRREQTEDVLQTVWLEVVRHRLRFQGAIATVRLRCWLPIVVRSKVADLLRREKRQPRQPPGGRELDPPAPEEDDPAMWLVKESERESVRAALARLREEETALNCRLLVGRYLKSDRSRNLRPPRG
jgi:RNA polymerase sigma factor (sigma-70 family)